MVCSSIHTAWTVGHTGILAVSGADGEGQDMVAALWMNLGLDQGILHELVDKVFVFFSRDIADAEDVSWYGVHLAGEDLIAVRFSLCMQRKIRMFFLEIRLFVKIQIAEHAAIAHIMVIDNRIVIRKVLLVFSFQKDICWNKDDVGGKSFFAPNWCLPRELGDVLSPDLRPYGRGDFMSTYKEFMVIIAIASLIVSILNLTHKK